MILLQEMQVDFSSVWDILKFWQNAEIANGDF